MNQANFLFFIKLKPLLLSWLQPRKSNCVPTELDVSISAKDIYSGQFIFVFICLDMTNFCFGRLDVLHVQCDSFKVYIFWEGHKILWNLHQLFALCTASQIIGRDFAKFCGLLRIYELYESADGSPWGWDSTTRTKWDNSQRVCRIRCMVKIRPTSLGQKSQKLDSLVFQALSV